MRTRLTKRRLWAIENSLTLSLAGAIESNMPSRRDYELALEWVTEEMHRRRKLPVDNSARI
jgi:hypothetical protein